MNFSSTVEKTSQLPLHNGNRLQPLPLRTNFFWTLIGNVFYAVAQWGKLIVLAKLGTPETVGQFTLGLAFGAPVIILFNLGLRPIQATDSNREFRFSDYLTVRLLTSTLAFLVISIIGFTFDYRREVALIILAVGIGKAFDAISEIYYGLLQQHERMDRIAVSMILHSAFSLLAMIFGFILTKRVLWSTLLGAAAGVVVLLVYDLPSAALIFKTSGDDRGWVKALQPTWNWQIIRKLILLSLPLGISAMLVSLNTNTPRYLIEHFLGEKTLGFYAAIAYLIVSGSTVINALGHSTSPRLARYYAFGEKSKYLNLLFRLLGISGALGLGGVLVSFAVGKEVLSFVYRPEYAKYIDVFIVLMVSGLAMYLASILNYGVTACRSFKIQTFISIAVVGSLIISGWIMIPSWGLLGAAWSVTISWSVQAILYGATIIYRLFVQPLNPPRMFGNE